MKLRMKKGRGEKEGGEGRVTVPLASLPHFWHSGRPAWHECGGVVPSVVGSASGVGATRLSGVPLWRYYIHGTAGGRFGGFAVLSLCASLRDFRVALYDACVGSRTLNY